MWLLTLKKSLNVMKARIVLNVVSIVREEKEQLPGWNDLCHLLEATEQL